MSDVGSLQVDISLQGADQFMGDLDSIDIKLKSVSSDAQTASGEQGLGGFGTAAGGANTQVGNLGSGTTSLGAKLGSLATATSTTVGGILNMASSYQGLQDQQVSVESASKRLETAIQSHEKAVDALNKIVKDGTLTQADYQKAVEGVTKAEQKVHDDQVTIGDDYRKIQDLQAKGKTGTEEYARAVEKLQKDQQTLTTDQGKLNDATSAYNDTVTKHVDTTSPKYIEALQKVQSTADQVKVAQDRLTEAQNHLNLAYMQFGLGVAQTVLGAFGTISALITTFAKDTSAGAKAANELGGALGGIPMKAGIVGIILTAIALALLAISQNWGGVRTGLEGFGKDLGDAVPWTRGFLDLLHGLGAEIGLTGKGFGAGGDEIKRAIKEIQDSFTSSNIGKSFDDLKKSMDDLAQKAKPDMDNIRTAIINFLKDPSIASGTELGKALLKGIGDGFKYVLDNLPSLIRTFGNQLNDALKTAMPKLDAVAAAVLNSLDDLIKHPGNAKDSIIKFFQWLFSDLTAIQKAVSDAINQLLATAFDPKNTAQTRTAFINLMKDLGEAGGKALTDATKAAWDGIVKLAQGAADSISKYIGSGSAFVTGLWKAATDETKRAWDALVKDVQNTIDGISKYLGAGSKFITDLWKAAADETKKAWDATTGIVGAVEKDIDAILAYIKKVAVGMFQPFYDDAKKVADQIKSYFDGIIDAIKKAIAGIQQSAQALQSGFTGGGGGPQFNPQTGQFPSTRATLPGGAVVVNVPGGISTAATTAAGGALVVNLVVSGRQLAQVVAPYNTGTSQF